MGIDRVCRATSGPVAVEQAVAGQLKAAVGFDAWCVMTIDPASVLPTGGYHEEGVPPDRLPHLVEIEAHGEDAMALPSMARTGAKVATLSQATAGRLEQSRRYREVLFPSGLIHELRAMFTTGSGAWGALIMFREAGGRDFTAAEIDLIARSTGGVASAIRREMVLSEIEHGDGTDGPGLVLLDESLAKIDATAGAVRWLGEIDDGVDVRSGLPYSVMTAAHRAVSNPTEPAHARIRTRTGRWLTMHAERLADHPDNISVIVEPTRPIEIAELMADAYGLTSRERQVVRLLAVGYSRTEIARMLKLSSHTIDDHVKSVFNKLAVSTRAELTAKLFFDQHLPRITTDVPVGGTGWFIR